MAEPALLLLLLQVGKLIAGSHRAYTQHVCSRNCAVAAEPALYEAQNRPMEVITYNVYIRTASQAYNQYCGPDTAWTITQHREISF